MAFFGIQLATSAVIKSKPGDFLRQYLDIIFLTLFGLKNFSGQILSKSESK